MKENNATETVLTPVDNELEKFFKLPEIYAFWYKMFPKALKVGFSIYGDNRLGQWNNTYPGGIKVVKRWSALLDGGMYFTDHPVHGKLIKNGKRRLTREDFPKDIYYSCEFFDDTTGNDVDNSINEVKSDFANGTELHKCKDINTSKFIGKHYKRNKNLVYKLRKMQKKIVENFLNAIEHNEREMLCVSTPRSGKCFASMSCANELKTDDNKVIIVVSAIVDVKDEWQRTVEIPMNFDGYYFLDSEDLEVNSNVIAETKKKGNVVIFLSLQDLKGKDVKEKHKELLKTPVDMLIVDETHFAARAPEYGEVLRKKDNDIVLNSDESDDCISKDVVCKYIKAKYWLHLTATPSAEIINEFNRPHQIIGYFTDKDLIDERNEWSLKNELSENPKSEIESPYAGLPNNMFIANDLFEAMKDMKRSSNSFLNDLFETKSTNKKGDYKHFVRDEYVIRFIHMLDGSISDPNVLSFFSNISIKKNGLGKHIVFQLPRCAACDAMMELIQNNLHTFNNLKNFEFINLAGLDNEFKNAKAYKDKIDKLDFEGKNTITFTVKRCLTGITIPSWDTIMFLSDVLSYKEYYQAVGRLKSSNIRNFKDGNGDIFKQIMKFQTICIDFNPHRAFTMSEEKARIQATVKGKGGNDGVLEELKTDFETAPMVFYGGLKFSKVKPVEMIDKLIEYSRNRSISDDVKPIADNINHIIFDSKVIQDICEKYKTTTIKTGKNKDKYSSFKSFDEPNINPENEPNINPENVNDGSTSTQNEDVVVDERQETEIITNPNQADNNSETDSNEKEEQYVDERQETETIDNHNQQDDYNIETDDNEKENQDVTGFLKFIEKICFFAILTDNEVISLKDVYDAISTNEDDMRKATHIGLDVNDVKNTYDELQYHNAINLHGEIDRAIMNSNRILNDSKKSLSVEEKVKILLTKFGRISENEVVLPNHIAKDMMTLVFDNTDNIDDKIILDISSKNAEIAVATNNIDPNKAKNVISLPSSPTSYEFTRKMYSVMGLPLENVISDFTTFDLIGEKRNDILKKLKDMKINKVVGNIPYQEKSENTSDKPIYNLFMDVAYDLCDDVTLITPARFLFNAGKTPQEWNEKMLNDPHLQLVRYYQNCKDVFSNADISGGIAITYRNANIKCKPIRMFTAYPELNSILSKVTSHKDFTPICDIIYLQNKFNLNELYNDHPEFKEVIGSNGRERRLTTNIFERVNIFTENKVSENDIRVVGTYGKNRREYKYVNKKYISEHDNLNRYKTIVPKSGTRTWSESQTDMIGEPIVLEPNVGYTQTFISFGAFENKSDANNTLKYIKSKFARVMLGVLKVTQHNDVDTWKYVPLQNFTSDSDIDWSKSIKEIDQQLYTKYGLSSDEIDFIESKIKPMS